MTIPPEGPAPEAVPPETVEPEQPANADGELKAFITELQKQLGGTAVATFPKAIVVSTETTASPPTCTVQFPKADGSAGDSIAGVRYFDHYTPVANDTVQLIKVGSDITAIGQLNNGTQGGSAQGWATAASSVQYRKVVDNGDFKIQFKGTWTGSGTTLFTLPTGFRPSVPRTILCGRSGNAASIKVQISTGGVTTLVDGTSIPDADSTTPASTGSVADHTHTGGTSGTAADHTHAGGTSGASGTAATGAGGGHSHTTTSHTHSLSSHWHDAHLDHVHTHGGMVPETSFVEVESTTGPSTNTSGGSAPSTDAEAAHTHTGPSHTHTTPTTGAGGTHSHTTPTSGASGTHSHTSAAHTHTLTLALPGTVYFDDTGFFL